LAARGLTSLAEVMSSVSGIADEPSAAGAAGAAGSAGGEGVGVEDSAAGGAARGDEELAPERVLSLLG